MDSRGGSGGNDLIQQSIDTLIYWETDWQMQFNVIKCKVLGMGRNNEKRVHDARGHS